MLTIFLNTIFRRSNKVQNMNETKEELVKINQQNKINIINDIYDFKTLNEEQLKNLKKQPLDSLLDIIFCFNNNQKIIIEIIDNNYNNIIIKNQ